MPTPPAGAHRRGDAFCVRQPHPYPYQRCYCSICRKSARGGYTINIMGSLAASLQVQSRRAIRVWHAVIDGKEGSAERHFLQPLRRAAWVSERHWPELIPPLRVGHRYAVAGDPATVYILLRDKASWVSPQIGRG